MLWSIKFLSEFLVCKSDASTRKREEEETFFVLALLSADDADASSDFPKEKSLKVIHYLSFSLPLLRESSSAHAALTRLLNLLLWLEQCQVLSFLGGIEGRRRRIV